MFKKNKNVDGFTFVIVLIVILVVGALVAAFFNSSIFNTRFSSIESDRSRAYFAAQSGIEHIKAKGLEDAFEDNTFSIPEKILTYDKANATYEVNLDTANSTSKEKIFVSSGKFNNSNKELYFVIIEEGLKNFGAFTTRTLSLKGSADIDGDIYVEMTRDQTEGFENYLVDPENNEIITSDDDFEFNFDYNTIYNKNDPETVLFDPEVDEFTTDIIKEYFLEDPSLTNIDKTVSDSPITVNDGDFLYFNDITMNGGGDLEISRANPADPPININIFVEEGFDIGGNSQFKVGDYINVNLWVKNKFDIDGTSPIIAEDNSKILTYLDPQIEEIQLAGNIDGNVLLYGPYTTFKLTGNASINGAIIADNITSTGSFEISVTEDDIREYGDLFISKTMGASRFKSMWSSK